MSAAERCNGGRVYFNIEMFNCTKYFFQNVSPLFVVIAVSQGSCLGHAHIHYTLKPPKNQSIIFYITVLRLDSIYSFGVRPVSLLKTAWK